MYLAKKQNNNALRSILFFLIMLYPILPQNYYVWFVNYSNVCSFLIVLVYLFYEKLRINTRPFRQNRFYWIYQLVYAVFAFVSLGLFSSISWLVSTTLVSMVLINLIRSESDIYRMIHGLVNGSFIVGLLGIIESLLGRYLFQSSLMEAWGSQNYIRYGILRCTALFGHPINLGMFQAVVCILIFYLILTKKISGNRKRRYMLIYLIDVICLFLTVSRLPIMFFVAGHMLLILKTGVRKSFKYICIAVVILALVLILSDTFGFNVFDMVADIIPAFKQLFGGTESTSNHAVSFGNRTDLYLWVWLGVGDKYVFGRGLDAQFAHQIAEWFTKTSIEVQYLNVFYHCGFVGLTFLVLSYIGTLRFFGKYRNSMLASEKQFGMGAVLYIIVILYYVCLFGVNESDLTRLYSMLVSIGIAYGELIKNAQYDKDYE